MKIYLLYEITEPKENFSENDYEERNVVGFFTTKEKVENWIAEKKKNEHWLKFEYEIINEVE